MNKKSIWSETINFILPVSFNHPSFLFLNQMQHVIYFIFLYDQLDYLGIIQSHKLFFFILVFV